jgi:hypothetical protein
MAVDRRKGALLLSSLVLAALPKCPACLLAYVGLAGVISLPPSSWGLRLLLFVLAALGLGLGALAVQALRRRAGSPPPSCCSPGR